MSKTATAPPETYGLQIPSHWSWSTFNQLSSRVTVGHVGSMKNEYRDSGIPFLRGQNVRANRFDPKGLKFVSREFHESLRKSELEANDIVVTRSGEVGVACVIPETLGEANCSDLVIIKQPHGIESKFAAYYLNSAAKRFIAAGKVGVAITHFNTKSVAALPVPLPPLPEQRRIVARIEELFSRLDAGVAALRHAKAQLQRYRQSVLAAAVTGQLTQAWREQNPQEDHAESSNLFGEPLPRSWACHTLETVVSEGPRNGYSPKCGADAGGSIVLKLSATSSARMLLNEKTTKVSLLPVDPKSHAWLHPNDVLIQRANSLELLGSTAIYQGKADQYVYPDLMMRVRLKETSTRKFLVLYLNSLLARNYFQRNATGVAGNMPKINGATLKALPVPVPPLAEQHQIVAEVEARTTAIDHLKAELDRQITRSNRLRQSVLKSSFQGLL